jgi:hypothetical protein
MLFRSGEFATCEHFAKQHPSSSLPALKDEKAVNDENAIANIQRTRKPFKVDRNAFPACPEHPLW